MFHLLFGQRKSINYHSHTSRRVERQFEEYDKVLKTLQYPKEVSRRIKSFADFMSFKGVQLQFLIYVLAPYIANTDRNLEEDDRFLTPKEADCLMYLCFLVRVYTMPDREYEKSSKKLKVDALQKQFNRLYWDVFGSEQCSFLCK